MIEKKTLNGETMALDGKHFILCRLNKCVLIYGGGDASWTATEFSECEIRLDGPALRTANFMAAFGMNPQAFRQQPPPAQGMPGTTKGEH